MVNDTMGKLERSGGSESRGVVLLRAQRSHGAGAGRDAAARAVLARREPGGDPAVAAGRGQRAVAAAGADHDAAGRR